MSHIASTGQLARNIFSGWATLLVEILVAFVLTPYIIIKLGAATYGVWSLMISVIGYLGLIDIGIRGSVGRYINHYLALKDQRAVSEVVGTSTIILTLLALLAAALAVILATNFSTIFPKTPAELVDDIRFALPLLAVGLWLSFISSVLANLLVAKEALYLANIYNLITLLVRSVAIYYVLNAGHGIPALVLVTLGASLLGNVLVWWSVKRVFVAEMPSFLLFNLARLKEMWRFGLASFAARTSGTLANDSAPIIGMWILGPEAVAIYSVALTLTQNARRVLDQASTAIFPSVMKAGAIKDFPGLRSLYLRFMDISFAIGSLVFVGLMVFSASFLDLWVGVEYSSGAMVIAILAIGYLMGSTCSTGPASLASLDRINITMWISLGEAIACLILTAALPGLFGLGLAGMALGSTLPRLFSSCALYPWLSIHTLGVELRAPLRRGIARNLGLTAAVAFGFWCIHSLANPTTWPGFAIAVALATVLHLLLIGSQYEGLPLIGPVTDRLRRLWHSTKQN
ncbi:MAG TPA: oligosaccharide flippase family protein [Azonexus sp.]|nr:oligosaccharide flippase family protein [Azonexus sp.]